MVRSVPQFHPFRLTSLASAAVGVIVWMVLLVPISSAAHGSSLRVLNGIEEALQVRIDLIQQADATIDLAYYAIDTDEVPIAFIELLRQAAVRGVHVRMLVDGLQSRLPAKFEQYLMECGIEVRVYHPPHQGNPRWLNRRLHSKLMVVDSEKAIIGSRNLENEYYHLDQGRNFIDCDAFVAGDVARHAQKYFDWLWQTPDVQPAPQRDSLGLDVLRYRPYGRSDWKEAWRHARGPADYQRLLDRSLRSLICRSSAELDSGRDWMTVAAHDVELRLLHDCASNKPEDRVQRGIVRIMDAAKCTLLIESPYPAFDRPIRSAITRARERGVCVTILTNSLKTTDQLNVYAAYQNQKRGLLREGVHVREYCGKDTLHAKTMIADDRTWMLGSYNFDARSDNLNLELCIISSDRAGAEQLRSSLQARLAHSTPIAKRTLILPVGTDASLFKRVRLLCKRTYIELIRGFL